MNRPRATRVAAGAAACALCLSVVAMGSAASAQSGCSSYALYSALGSASGVRTLQHAPGVTIVTDADGGLPAAQAQFDSVGGSIGWAGAPYSATVADNAGQAQQQPNDVPVFAYSSHPTTPDGSKETPAGNMNANSGADGSTASYDGGGPASDQSSTGHVRLSVSATCLADGTIEALADNTVESVNIAGVLRIGSVHSHAKVVVAPDGQRQLDGTIVVDGVTVLGQPASITDQGLVVGPSSAPLPANPLTSALVAAGVSIAYIDAVKDEERGEVFAPGVEISVAQDVPGSGPKSTTYTFGRAFARGVKAGDASAPSIAVPAPTLTTPTVPAPAPSAPAPIPTGQVAAPAPNSAAPSLGVPASRIVNWSIAPAYTALALGALLLLAVRLLFPKLAARFRWT